MDGEQLIQELSAGQIECLMLVNEQYTSKEIASQLGISPHTVDQRIRRSLQVLGVERRSHAARLVSSIVSLPKEGCEIATPPDQRPQSSPPGRLPLPFATQAQPDNQLSAPMRLFWIVAIAMGSMVASALYLAGLESLGRMIQQHG